MNHKKYLTEQIFNFIDLIYNSGVKEMVISPGSRSTPLAIAAEIHPSIKTYVHPDERSAAFFALGLIKGSRHPVAIICTSGTAASNYTPAVSEAFHANLPLVVITADRPEELRDIGAPQTINQRNMYNNFIKSYYELEAADENNSDRQFLESVIDERSVFYTGTHKGPIHYNVQVREPLMPDISRTELFTSNEISMSHDSTSNPPDISVEGTGLILIGETHADLSLVGDDLKALGVPIVMDPRQNLRTSFKEAVTNHDLIFSYINDEVTELFDKIDFVIRIGDPFTSKSTNQFLSRLKDSTKQIFLSEFEDLKTYPVSPDEYHIGDITKLIKAISIDGKETHNSWYEYFLRLNDTITESIREHVVECDDEGRFTYELLNALDDETIIFASNSMPIRDIERYDISNNNEVYSNRGANGIDGVTSTALGMAVHRHVTLVIGDLAFYHDMNGLLMAKLEEIDINIVVFNNNGGGIFSFLPQYQEKAVFEKLFGTPADLEFVHAAKLYNFNYEKLDSRDSFKKISMPAAGRNILEIITDREHNLKEHQKLKTHIYKAVRDIEYPL